MAFIMLFNNPTVSLLVFGVNYLELSVIAHWNTYKQGLHGTHA